MKICLCLFKCQGCLFLFGSELSLTLSLLRKTRNYFANLDTDIKDNRQFWEKVNVFSEKSLSKESILFTQKYTIVIDSADLAETFNKFFNSVVKNLNVDDNTINKTISSNIEDPVLRGRENTNAVNEISFSFKFVTEE